MPDKETVAVLGASNNVDRYSYKAFKLLTEYGHRVINVHPSLDEIEGNPVLPDLSQIHEKVDTLTLYLRPEISESMAHEIIMLSPVRVIMNPGTESDQLEKKLTEKNIKVIRACTLVLLKTNQF